MNQNNNSLPPILLDLETQVDIQGSCFPLNNDTRLVNLFNGYDLL